MIKKKILYVITKSVWGGAQRYVYDLATNLPKDKFEVVVVTGGEGRLAEKLREAEIQTITLEPLQKKNGTLSVLFDLVNLRLLLLLIKIFRAERPDVIHLNSSKVGGIGALAASIYKLSCYGLRTSCIIKVVFTVHGWPFKEDRPMLSKIAIWFLSWLSSLFQDKIILINHADFRTAEKFIPRSKLALIFNGIGEIEFLERMEARKFLANKLGRSLTSDTLIIGTNAELTANKGLTYLLRSLASCSTRLNLVALIIGEGEEHQRLERLIETAGLYGRVHLLGFVPEAARYLKGFDLFVLPSLKEGLPYTIMEAMSAGLAIVASNVGGVPDLIKHKMSGYLVKPKDASTLAEAIQEALENPAKRAVLGKTAREQIKTRFALQTMIESTSKLYDEETRR